MVSFRINTDACDGKKLKQVFLQVFSLSPALAHRLIYSDSSCFASFSQCAAVFPVVSVELTTPRVEMRRDRFVFFFFLVCLSNVVVCSQTKELCEVSYSDVKFEGELRNL